MFKKLNRKAYTLIEILAVVVILGILLLIAVPAINKQLNKFREDYYIKLEKSVVSAGKDYITEKRYSKPNQLLYSRIVKVNDLEDEGFIEEVKDYLGEKCDSTDTSYSYVVVVKMGEKKYQYRTCLKCSKDEYYTDTSGEKNDLCNVTWITNDGITYENEGSFSDSEFLYVYYGTSEDYIKSQVGLEYKIIKKDSKSKKLAELKTGNAVYPDNLNELVGKNVNTKITLNYKLPDNTVINKEAIIYKHSAPKITMTYLNDKVVNGTVVKSAGSAYTPGEWTNGVKVRIEFNDTDSRDVLNYVDIDKVEYYDDATDTWKAVCSNVKADYCIWNRSADFNKTVKFRITNSEGHVSDVSSEYTIRVDASAPTCGTKVENASWTNASKTVSVGCVDSGYSTCSKATYSETYPTGSVLNKKVTSIKIYDNAGNSATCSLNVYVDTTKPSSCSISLKDAKGNTINDGATANYDVTFTVTGIDNKTDDSDINTSKTYAKIGSIKYEDTASLDNGTYTVTPVCTDNAGNVTTGSAVSFTLNKTVTITYMANGGSGSTNATICNYNQNCTIANNGFDRTGHTFNGWNTNATGTGTNHSAGGTVKLTAPLKLYAKWKANTYTITYTLNGGTNNSSNPNSYTYGVGVASFSNASKDGYTFKGWYTESSFTNKITGITTTTTGNKNLYAKFTANSYTLTYDNQSGTGCTSKGGAYDSAWGDLCEPSRAGYTFGGWYTEASGKGTKIAKTTVCKGNLKVYAKWTANNYTLTYDNQGGNNCDKKTGSYGSTWGNLCTPNREGYTFGGWYTETSGKGTQITSESQVLGSMTVYAKWSANVYNISYTMNNGTNHSSNPSKYTYGVGVSSFYNPSRTCYTFGGWFSNSGLTTSKTSISKTETGDKTLYAKWTQNSCSITFNDNGGSGGPGSQTKYCGTDLTLSSKTPTRDGHTFEGWDTKSDGSGDDYAAGGKYTSNTCTTLYAKWKKSSYTLSFDKNGGAGVCNDKTLASGEKYGTLCTPTKANHKFDGWYTAKTGGTKVTSDTKMGTSNVTLYAHWTAITCTFSGNGSSSSDWAKSRKVTCSCTDGSSDSETYTSSGDKTLSISGTPGCSFTVYKVDSGKPTITYNGKVASNVQCPSGSEYNWLDAKWTFTIKNTASGFRASGSQIVISMSNVGTGTYTYGNQKKTSGLKFGCPFWSTTEFGFARSNKPSFTVTACNNVGNCESLSA